MTQALGKHSLHNNHQRHHCRPPPLLVTGQKKDSQVNGEVVFIFPWGAAASGGVQLTPGSAHVKGHSTLQHHRTYTGKGHACFGRQGPGSQPASHHGC